MPRKKRAPLASEASKPRKPGRPPKKPEKGTCDHCGSQFMKYRRGQRFCSEAHRNAASYKSRTKSEAPAGMAIKGEEFEEAKRLARMIRVELSKLPGNPEGDARLRTLTRSLLDTLEKGLN
jgi:hypothetical protein